MKPKHVIGIVGILSFALIASILYINHIDWPAREKPLPASLSWLVENDSDAVTGVLTYNLGIGFIDKERLMRIHAKPRFIDLFVRELGLQPIDLTDVPPAFWDQPPYWWKPVSKPNTKFFKTRKFTDQFRGEDGNHYLLMTDEENGIMYLWAKNNF